MHARNATRRNQDERFVHRIMVRAGLQKYFRDLVYVVGQHSISHRILGDEIEQRRVTEVVSAFEVDPFTNQLRMFLKQSRESG